MKELTARQKEILDLIKESIKNKGFPPTRADIAKKLGFKSANAAEQHLRAIEKKGFISILQGASRGIVLNEAKTLGLPLVGLVAAGGPILAEQNIEKNIDIPPSLFDRSADFLLRVKGNSMVDLGKYEDDLIAVKKANECKDGEVIVARIGEEVTVKTFRVDGEGEVFLEPANSEYKPIRISNNEEFYLEGVCVGLIKKF